METEQQRLIRSIFSHDNPGNFDPRGLAIYRRNLVASACRALSVTFPTVEQLIGESLFRHAAQQMLSEFPPTAPDWGVWGEHFSRLLGQLPELEAYPYVRDCAQLDYACHLLNRAADCETDFHSLQLLVTAPTDHLLLQLSEGFSVLTSDYPVADIWLAHHDSDELSEDWIDRIHKKTGNSGKHGALVYRENHRVRVREISVDEQRWLGFLQQGMRLSDALDEMQDTDFNFENWLPEAVSQNIVSAVITADLTA